VMLKPYYSRVQPILEAEEEPRGHAGRLDKIHGQIEMSDVRFRYGPGMPLVLKGLSLTVPAGKVVAIVGPSGAGKSSLVRLLLGFETPEAGDVYIDGTDIRVLDPQDLRRNFGVVLQNGRLLAGSIYDNVSAGLALDEEQVMAALRMASLDEAVKALPMGLHTNVGDGGVAFSGGQRQRLLIARAVIRQPSVLILDEATSALDNVTQRDVVERLKSLQCTQIVIAQRLSTVMAADIIHVIDDGQVVESGTYQELMAKSGLFSQLAQRQLL
jgi:ABC-type bacteriocin/lantibiotic exporter with double-glycine peptidase domain